MEGLRSLADETTSPKTSGYFPDSDISKDGAAQYHGHSAGDKEEPSRSQRNAVTSGGYSFLTRMTTWSCAAPAAGIPLNLQAAKSPEASSPRCQLHGWHH